MAVISVILVEEYLQPGEEGGDGEPRKASRTDDEVRNRRSGGRDAESD